MTTGHVTRDEVARRAALYRYAQAHERFATLEQLAHSRGRPAEANGAHLFALITLRAYIAEQNDPAPEGLKS